MNVIGAPAVSSTKIIDAKLRYHFQVLFFSDSGTELPYGRDLTVQVLEVGEILQASYGGVNDLVISFEDDADNRCCSAIQNLFNESSFTIKIELLDGRNVARRTYKLTGCSILEVSHGSLDYFSIGTVNTKLKKNVLFNVNGMSVS